MPPEYNPVQAKLYNCLETLKMLRANQLEVLDDTIKCLEKHHPLRRPLINYKDEVIRAYNELRAQGRTSVEYTPDKNEHVHIWLHINTEITAFTVRKYQCNVCGTFKRVTTFSDGSETIGYCGWDVWRDE